MNFLIRDDIEPKKVEKYETKKQTLLEEVESIARNLVELKDHRRETPKHVKFSDLPKEDRFKMLGMKSKYFIDVIKLVAYHWQRQIFVVHCNGPSHTIGQSL